MIASISPMNSGKLTDQTVDAARASFQMIAACLHDLSLRSREYSGTPVSLPITMKQWPDRLQKLPNLPWQQRTPRGRSVRATPRVVVSKRTGDTLPPVKTSSGYRYGPPHSPGLHRQSLPAISQRGVSDRVSLWPSRDPIGEDGGWNLYGMVGNVPVSWVDFLGLDWIEYTGETVNWYEGEAGDRSKKKHCWKGTSGMEGSQSKENADQENEGPTPEGEYEVNLEPDPDRVAPETNGGVGPNPGGGISQLPKDENGKTKHPAWGDQRAKIGPKKGTKTHGRHSFYFHDSAKGYTHGCVECPDQTEGDYLKTTLFDALKEY
jgi:hypothetical protein